MTDRESQIAEIWGAADAAAVEACCAGWPAEKVPQSAYLSLRREPATEYAEAGDGAAH